MIYLDYAATSLKRPECVVAAVADAMQCLGNSGRGLNRESLEASRTIYAAREKISDFFHLGDPSRVCFTSNSTEALNTAIFGLFQPGDHIISTDLEHNSVLRPLYHLMRQGVEVDFLPVDKNGRIREAEAEGLIRKETKAIISTHASNLTGNLVDIHVLGEIAKKHGLLFLVDASQTAGSFPVDMKADHISVLCFTGHKGLMGPQGTGGLCVGDGVEIAPLKCGGTGVQTHLKTQPLEYPVRLEAGTLNGHGIAGLLRAIEYIEEIGMERIHNWEHSLMQQFYEGICDIPGIEIYGDFAKDRAPIVAFNLPDWDSGEVSDVLWQEYDISVRSGAHCAPRMHEALGTKEKGAVRFSFGWFTTREEVEKAILAVRSLN